MSGSGKKKKKKGEKDKVLLKILNVFTSILGREVAAKPVSDSSHLFFIRISRRKTEVMDSLQP